METFYDILTIGAVGGDFKDRGFKKHQVPHLLTGTSGCTKLFKDDTTEVKTSVLGAL